MTFQKQMARVVLILALTVVGMCFTMNEAQAYYAKTCNGKIFQGIHSNKTVRIHRYSIAYGGKRETEVMTAINEWNGIVGMIDRFSWKNGSETDTDISHSNNKNTIFYNNYKSGINGRTYKKYWPCISPYWSKEDGHIKAFDIGINSNTSLTLPLIGTVVTTIGLPQYCATTRNARVGTGLHELGHSLGLKHEKCELMSLMWPVHSSLDGYQHGLYCGPHIASPHPTEIHFATKTRFHGSGQSSFDAAASSHHYEHLSGNTRTRLNKVEEAEGSECLKPGKVITYEYSWADRGTEQIQDMKVTSVLSKNKTITIRDIVLDTWTTSNPTIGCDNPRPHFKSQIRSAIIPNTVTKGETYYLGYILDPDNEIAETYENNNATYLKPFSICP